MLELPLLAWPNQSFLVTLDGQDCRLALYERSVSVFLDLDVNGEPVARGAICQSGIGIIQNATSLFAGQLCIIDTLPSAAGQERPRWQGLGARWRLYWHSEEEIAELEEAFRG